MKYVKSFSIFESQAVNEAATANVLSAEGKKKLKEAVDKLPAEKKEQLKMELATLATKLKLKVEDLNDTKKVGDALVKAGLVKENFEFEGNDLNEGIFSGIKSWWSKAKMTVAKWMTGLGVSGLVGGIISTAIGGEMMGSTDHLYHSQTVDPNAAVVIGLTAAAIGMVSLLVGLKTSGQLGDVASGAAAGRR
jgi:hypothetical protein